jgi:hypothetical protein
MDGRTGGRGYGRSRVRSCFFIFQLNRGVEGAMDKHVFIN